MTYAENGKWDVPLYNGIDLLIVDESGQVSPELAVPSFSLAKQAILVGDIQQIEPVWSISDEYSFINLKNLALFPTSPRKNTVSWRTTVSFLLPEV